MRELVPFFNDRASLTRSLGDQMDKLLNEIFSKDFFPGALAKGTYPKMNVYDDQGSLCVDACVPDLPRDKVHVEVNDNVLTIRGESNQDEESKDATYYCREVSKRAFSRGVRLPENVDTEGVTAELRDGMLKIRVPYRANKKQEKGKQIEIK